MKSCFKKSLGKFLRKSLIEFLTGTLEQKSEGICGRFSNEINAEISGGVLSFRFSEEIAESISKGSCE